MYRISVVKVSSLVIGIVNRINMIFVRSFWMSVMLMILWEIF